MFHVAWCVDWSRAGEREGTYGQNLYTVNLTHGDALGGIDMSVQELMQLAATWLPSLKYVGGGIAIHCGPPDQHPLEANKKVDVSGECLWPWVWLAVTVGVIAHRA